MFQTSPEQLAILQQNYQESQSIDAAKKFTAIVKLIRVGGTQKLTGWDRLTETNNMIVESCQSFEHVHFLDVGASDGIVTVQLADRLASELSCEVEGEMFDLFTELLRYGPSWFCEYRTAIDAPVFFIFGPFIASVGESSRSSAAKRIAVHFYQHVRRSFVWIWEQPSKISLVNPVVHERSNIGIGTQNVFERNENWIGKFNLVRASNILNRGYFEDRQLRLAVSHLISYLSPHGLLVISRNHEEKLGAPDNGSVWRKVGENRLELVASNRDGSCISDLIEQEFVDDSV